MSSIPGNTAIMRMRQLSSGENTHFVLIHLTYDRTTGKGGEIRKVERCAMRLALRDETFNLPADHYLPYLDLDTGKPKMCWRKLIRYVALPPDYQLQKVDWFNKAEQ